MSRKVSFQCGFSDPTTTLDLAAARCEPVTRVVTTVHGVGYRGTVK